MYKNRFTRANPGLLVFMVDQSGSMGDPWADGKSKAEMTSLVINRCIQETIQKTTDIKEGVKDEVKIVVIGYGGIEKSDNAYVIVKGSNAELADSPLRTEMVTKKQPDGAGGLVETKYNMAIWVEPKAVWGTPMASAFEMAYQLIDGWVKKTQNRQVNPEAGNGLPQDDPVPIIINITGQYFLNGEICLSFNVLEHIIIQLHGMSRFWTLFVIPARNAPPFCAQSTKPLE